MTHQGDTLEVLRAHEAQQVAGHVRVAHAAGYMRRGAVVAQIDGVYGDIELGSEGAREGAPVLFATKETVGNDEGLREERR